MKKALAVLFATAILAVTANAGAIGSKAPPAQVDGRIAAWAS